MGVAVELSTAASGEKATEAVLFSDTSELSWATGPEEGAPDSQDRLILESWLPGVSFVPAGALKGLLLGGLLPLAEGLGLGRSRGFSAARQVGPELSSGPLWLNEAMACLLMCRRAGYVAFHSCCVPDPC